MELVLTFFSFHLEKTGRKKLTSIEGLACVSYYDECLTYINNSQINMTLELVLKEITHLLKLTSKKVGNDY